MTGFYDITTILKNQLIQDPFVNTVTEGDIFEVDLAKQTIFPLSHIMVNQAVREGHAIRFNITVMCMDIVDKTKDETVDAFLGNDNEQDVLNTQLAVALRCVEVLDRGNLRESATLDGEVTFEPFTERFENYLAGWSATFDVLVRNTMTACDAGSAPITCTPAPVGAKPIKTGQTVSYASEDDGATQRGRLVDFFTLDSNNAFGNTNRFTDLTGGQTYASNGVFLDHSTDNGNEILAFTNSPTNTNWSGSLTSIAAQSTDGKTDWYMPNVQELNLLVNEASNPNLNWTPLTTVATPFTGNIYCWTSTTPISNTARAKAFYSSTAIDGNEMLTLAKTLGVRSLACRYYTYAELGL